MIIMALALSRVVQRKSSTVLLRRRLKVLKNSRISMVLRIFLRRVHKEDTITIENVKKYTDLRCPRRTRCYTRFTGNVIGSECNILCVCVSGSLSANCGVHGSEEATDNAHERVRRGVRIIDRAIGRDFATPIKEVCPDVVT